MNTILFLAANPLETSQLRLDEEYHQIQEGLRRSDRRAELSLYAKWAVRSRDVSRAILEIRPNIVHFSGHGRGHQGLVLQDDAGQACTVPASALAELFRIARRSVECVILNACFSEVQAVAIGKHIPHVIGMPGAVSDRAAVEFAVGFYDALGAGEPFEIAYEWGCTATAFAGVTPASRPKLIVNRRDSAAPSTAPREDFNDAPTPADERSKLPVMLKAGPGKPPATLHDGAESRVCTVMLIDFSDALLLPHHDLHQLQEVTDRCYRVILDQVTSLGGIVARPVSDHAMAVFGLPRASDNDAERALAAAARIHAALSAVPLPRALRSARPSARIGVSTGRVLATPFGPDDERQYRILGEPVKTATHLQQLADRGATLIARDTFRHVVGLFNCKPLNPERHSPTAAAAYLVDGPIPLRQLITPPTFYGLDTRFVGRAGERHRLAEALETVLVERRATLVSLVGPPGAGRSRLLAEFFAGLTIRNETFFVLTSQCSTLSQQTAYGVVASIIRQRFGIQDGDAPDRIRHKLRRGLRWFRTRIAGWRHHGRVAASSTLPDLLGSPERIDIDEIVNHMAVLLGLPGSAATTAAASPTEDPGLGTRLRTAATLARLLDMVARRFPIVILCDDVHWADDASLHLVEELLVRCSSLPILVVCAARIELHERMPHFGECCAVHDRIELGLLARRHIEEMLRDRLRYVPEMSPELIRQLTDRAEGNPLTLTEMLHYLVDAGVLDARGEDPWVLHAERLGDLSLPATIQKIVQARLDRLPVGARNVLTQAAVVGRTFWAGAIEHIQRSQAEPMSSTDLHELLGELRDRQIIRARPSTTFPEETEFVFTDSATHEVAYDALSPQARRRMHLGVAEWLRGRTDGDRMVGLTSHHYDMAGDHRPALECYAGAAVLAASAGDNTNALQYLDRACALQDLLGSAEPVSERSPTDIPGACAVSWVDRVALRLQRGDVLCRIGRLDDAERDYACALERDLPADRHAVEPRFAAEALRWDARLHFRLALLRKLRGSDMDGALSFATAAIERARSAGLHEETPPMYALLAFLYRRLSMPLESWGAAREGLRVCRGLPRRDTRWRAEVAQLLIGIAVAQLARGYIVRAERAYRQASRAVPESSHPHVVGIALNGVAGTRVKQGDVRGARDVYLRALRLKQRAGDMFQIAVGYSNLAEVELALDDTWAALEHARCAVQLGEQIRAGSDLADMYRNLAEAQRANGDLEGALESCEKALAVSGTPGRQLYFGEVAATLTTVCRQILMTSGHRDPRHRRAAALLIRGGIDHHGCCSNL